MISIKNNFPKKVFETNETNKLKKIKFSIDPYTMSLDRRITGYLTFWKASVFISPDLHNLFTRRLINAELFEGEEKNSRSAKYKFEEKYIDSICVISLLYREALFEVLNNHLSEKIKKDAKAFTDLVSDLHIFSKCFPIDVTKDKVDLKINVWRGKGKEQKLFSLNSNLPILVSSLQNIFTSWDKGSVLNQNKDIRLVKTIMTGFGDQAKIKNGIKQQEMYIRNFTELTWDLFHIIKRFEMIPNVGTAKFPAKILQCIIDIYTLIELPPATRMNYGDALLSWEPSTRKETIKKLHSWLSEYSKSAIPIDERGNFELIPADGINFDIEESRSPKSKT